MENKRKYKGKNIIADIHNYTVIDLETTGLNINDCEIIELAAVKVENDKVVGKYSSLVQPSKRVPNDVTKITGITNDMLIDAPKLDEVIEDYLLFIGNDTILGHNISTFDTVILYDLCERLNLPHFCNDMLDTASYAHRCNIDVNDYKLQTLTQYFDIDHTNAHRALADCLANHECYQQLKKYFNGIFHNSKIRKREYIPKTSEETQKLRELIEVVKEIISDNVLEESEILHLNNWINQNEELAGNYPYDCISEALQAILDDGIVTDDEKTYLMSIISEFDDPVSKRSCNIEDDDLSGSNAVLTGDFSYGSKDSVAKKLEFIGINIQNSVSKSTNYVIVGDLGSSKWSQGNYGSKVKKAIELQEKGSNIKIVREGDFFKVFDSQKGQKIIGIKQMFDRINKEISVEQRIPESVLHLEQNINVQNESESVWIKEPVSGKYTKLIFNCFMRGRKNDRYATFVVQNNVAENVVAPENVEFKKLVSDHLHTYINVKVIDEDIEQYVKRIISYCIIHFEPSDKFGCCGKYQECSKERKCIHNDLFYAKACWYRKNLEAGKVFY